MYISDTFATEIKKRIEPVVTVSHRQPETVLNELTNLVVTPQWEKHLHRILEEYTDAFDREDEREIGIWISGFFGSGKSLLMKMLGILLSGGEVEGQSIHQLFLQRLPPHSQERSDLERFLAICQRKLDTSLVGGNLHENMAHGDDPLVQLVFKFFSEEHEYTKNWAFAWTIEYQIDNKQRTEAFRERVCDLSGMEWEAIASDPDFYIEHLYKSASEILPENFSSPEAVQQAVTQTHLNGITPQSFIDRMCRWCKNQDKDGRRRKLLLQIDELGQWIQSGSNTTKRLMEIQALVETASTRGQGRIWIAVTAHGDVQALKQNVQQELYAKINQRFDIQCKLSNEDIDKVVRERLLRKTQPANSLLRERFRERSGEIIDLGSLHKTRRIYRVPGEENFADFYPYLPWMIDIIPNIVKGIAQAANRSEELTGSNRTMIAVVQGCIIDTAGLLESPVGRLISLADLYEQLSTDAPTETRTDIQRIQDSVKNSTPYTTRVACALYLLGQDEHIPCTLQNVTLAMINSIDTNLGEERTKVKAELDRLVAHGYVKQVGDTYVFLSTQQRSFQDKVRHREQDLLNRNFDLSLKLREYEKGDVLRFDRVPVKGQLGREKYLKIELDGRVIYNPTEQVIVHIYSPMQYFLDQDLANDAVIKQRSNQEPNAFFFRMGEVKELRRALAKAVATKEVADEVLISGAGNDPEKKVALSAKEQDLSPLEENVRYALRQAVQEGKVFLRGSSYDLADGANASDAMRNTLSYLLFSTLYTRFQELPHRITNEAAAVKAALNDNTTQSDLQALGVYNADGTLNTSNALLSTLKGLLPLAEDDRGAISADELRQKIELPPYGWDGNAVKVGLALLLRAGQCRLLENSATLTNPTDLAVVEALTKAMRFKSLRIQGMRSGLDTKKLLEVRGYILTIFNAKLPVQPVELNNGLGDQLKKLQVQAQSIQEWAITAQCKLPVHFGSGHDLVAEILNIATPDARLPYFIREWEAIQQYKQTLQELTRFKSEYGQQYLQMREFFLRMTDAPEVPEAVVAFHRDWRTVDKEGTITNAQRWSDLITSYHTAWQALTERIEQWRQEALQSLSTLQGKIKSQLETAGVPTEHIEEEQAKLLASIQRLQRDLEQEHLEYSDVRRLRNQVEQQRINLPTRIREIGLGYRPTPPEPPMPPTAEVYMNWQNLLGRQVRISSPSDLEQLTEKLRRHIATELTKGKIVIVE